MANLELLIRPAYMPEICRINPESLQEIRTSTERMCKLQFKAWIFLLWGDSADRCTTVPQSASNKSELNALR